MKVVTRSAAMVSTRSSLLPKVGNRPVLLHNRQRVRSRRGSTWTLAYLIADRLSATTERPAMPNAMVRRIRHRAAPSPGARSSICRACSGCNSWHGHRCAPATPSSVSNLCHDVVIVEHVALDGRRGRRDLRPRYFVASAVDGIEQALPRFTRAPKNCICLPIRMAETQQAMP